MYIDNILRLSGSGTGQSVLYSQVTTNTVDLAAALYAQGRDIGEGRSLYVNFVPTVAAAADVSPAAAGVSVEFEVLASPMAAPATVTLTDGTEKVNLTAHGFAAGTPVQFIKGSSTAALPSELSFLATYYVLNPGANDFELAATPGGSQIAFGAGAAGTLQILTSTLVGASGPQLYSTLTVPAGGVATAHPVRINPKVASLGGRYLMGRYLVRTSAGAESALTAGSFLADLVLGVQDGRKYYASGFAVS